MTVRNVAGKWLILSSISVVDDDDDIDGLDSSRLMLKNWLGVIAVRMVEGEQWSLMRVDGDAEVDASVSVDDLTLKLLGRCLRSFEITLQF